MSMLGRGIGFMSAGAPYATLDPAMINAQATLSNGNLTARFPNANSNTNARSTIAKSSGVWFCEVTSSTSGTEIGICNSVIDINTQPSVSGVAFVYYGSDGHTYTAGSGTAYGATFVNSVIGVKLDATNKTVEWFKDGTSQGVVSIPSGPFAGPYYLVLGYGQASDSQNITVNFGASAFSFPANVGTANPGWF